MMGFRTQRLRDPVHGLIVFREGNRLDELAWSLVNTPEFQRLRRIKQLGVSEYVYPGATHTRFAHSIGVFHTARLLVEIIKRELLGKRKRKYEPLKAEVAIIAALLHDLGHGPLSHTFEGVLKSLGEKKRHEEWTAQIISNSGGAIWPLLKGFRKKGDFGNMVAELLASEDPKDIYHAVVSSSFDADRLDYLQRDRLLTGTGAGAIDFDWLIEHLRVRRISLAADDIETPDGDASSQPSAETFCMDLKALPAAEAFLMARYTLHEQVYFHKTTRCIEHMIAALLRRVASHARMGKSVQKKTGLPKHHPIIRFLSKGGATVSNYLALDDGVLFASLEQMSNATDPTIGDLATRLRERRLFKTLDMRTFGPDKGTQNKRARRIEARFSAQLGTSVLKDDSATLSIYSQVGGDDEKAHKKLRILDGDGKAREISSVSKVIEELSEKKSLVRYYFANEPDRAEARS